MEKGIEMSLPCTKEDAIDTIKEDVREIRHDVKLLLQETAALKIKSAIWGGIGGCLPFIIGLFFYIINSKK